MSARMFVRKNGQFKKRSRSPSYERVIEDLQETRALLGAGKESGGVESRHAGGERVEEKPRPTDTVRAGYAPHKGSGQRGKPRADVQPGPCAHQAASLHQDRAGVAPGPLSPFDAQPWWANLP